MPRCRTWTSCSRTAWACAGPSWARSRPSTGTHRPACSTTPDATARPTATWRAANNSTTGTTRWWRASMRNAGKPFRPPNWPRVYDGATTASWPWSRISAPTHATPIDPSSLPFQPELPVLKSIKVIITCAVTGSIHTPSMSPRLPITGPEIAEAAIGAAEAGAAIVHLHARKPEDGSPSQDPELFKAFLPQIKAASDVVINITTGGAPTMLVTERLVPVHTFKPE